MPPALPEPAVPAALRPAAGPGWRRPGRGAGRRARGHGDCGGLRAVRPVQRGQRTAPVSSDGTAAPADHQGRLGRVRVPAVPARAAPAAARRDLERLDPDEREIYDDARMDYHGELKLVATPDIRKITTTGEKLIIGNRGKQLGRRGLIVSGPSGTGKSTSITQLGKIHQVEHRAAGPARHRAHPGRLHHRPAGRDPQDARHRDRRVPRPALQQPRAASTSSPSPSPGCSARSAAPWSWSTRSTGWTCAPATAPPRPTSSSTSSTPSARPSFTRGWT